MTREFSRHYELLLIEIGLETVLSRESEARRQRREAGHGPGFGVSAREVLGLPAPSQRPPGRPRKYPTEAAAREARLVKERARDTRRRATAKNEKKNGHRLSKNGRKSLAASMRKRWKAAKQAGVLLTDPKASTILAKAAKA